MDIEAPANREPEAIVEENIIVPEEEVQESPIITVAATKPEDKAEIIDQDKSESDEHQDIMDKKHRRAKKKEERVFPQKFL